MKNQVLSIEQMQHLKELGVDTKNASMCWQRGSATRHVWVLYPVGNMSLSLPDKERTFTLQDVLEFLPKKIKSSIGVEYHVLIEFISGEWEISYTNLDEVNVGELAINHSKSLLDAAYEVLCWCAENSYSTN